MIISKSFKQKLIIPIESCFLEGRKLNIAKLVDMSFLADDMKNRQGIAFAKFDAKMTVFCKSYGNVLIRVFLHAEFISAKKTVPKSLGFEKYAKNGIKNINH